VSITFSLTPTSPVTITFAAGSPMMLTLTPVEAFRSSACHSSAACQMAQR
jgi:hypothetical protein